MSVLPPANTAKSPGSWCVEIYRLSDQGHQECVLEAFRKIGRPDVPAIAARSGHDHFVILELMKPAGRIHALRVLFTIDGQAQRTYSTLEPQPEESR